MNRQMALVIAAITVVIAVALTVFAWRAYEIATGRGEGSGSPRLAAAVKVGGPFELIDQTGRTVTEQDFKGTYMLIYFGYTFCPDVCPTELQDIAVAVDALGEAGERVTPIFITVDPARDTVEMIADYVAAFHPRMVGLTGDEESIKKVAKAYRVYYAKVDDEASSDYLVDHTSFIYLMGPDGEFETLFRYNTSPEDMAESIREILNDRG